MLVLVGCNNSSKDSDDEGRDYEITGNVAEDAPTIVDALVDCAEDDDAEAVDDLFGEVLKKYDNPADALSLWLDVIYGWEQLDARKKARVDEFWNEIYDNSKYKNIRKFLELLDGDGETVVVAPDAETQADIEAAMREAASKLQDDYQSETWDLPTVVEDPREDDYYPEEIRPQSEL